MAILEGNIPIGVQIPASGQNCGGGMIVAIFIGAGGQGTNYDLEHSPDGGTTWGAVTDEAGVAQTLVYAANKLYQINPPVRAPLFRLNSDTNETDAILNYKVHTM